MSNQNQLALIKRDTVDVVAERIRAFQEAGEIHFPANYSPENALKAAWLTLQSTVDRQNNPVLQVCTKDSVANALLDMVVQGLSPQKDQGYFIAFGRQLTFMRSYFGTMAVTKRVTGAKDIYAQVVYDGDDFEYDIMNGKKNITKHVQKLGNVNTANILGAYCTIDFGDDRTYTEIMSMDEIKSAWNMSPSKGGKVHKEFPQEMAKRTVINRTCKMYLNTSDDSSLVMHHFHRTDEAIEEAQIQEEIEQNANAEAIDIEYEDVTENVEEEQVSQEHESPLMAEQETEDQMSMSGPGF